MNFSISKGLKTYESTSPF